MSALQGRTVAVTGGGRGLGLGIAEEIARQGGNLALAGRNDATLQSAATLLRQHGTTVTTHVADLADPAQVDRFADEVMAAHGSVEGLVNNAGIADEARFLDITDEGWQQVVDVNLTAPFYCSQRFARRMAAGSAIVNIASIDAHGADGPFASYVAAKAGLIGLTKAAATELGPRGIRVNSVSPGWTLTEMAEESVAPTTLERMKNNFQRVPLGRMTEVTEVAASVAFLLSGAASGITGIDLAVDGGVLANLYVLETLEESD